jgi:hypothetical protein
MIRKNIYISLVIAAFTVPAVIFPAWAACVATCAVTESVKLAFATLEKPAAGSVTYAIAPDTGTASGTATLLYGTSARGQYTLTRTGVTTGCANTTVSVANVSTGNAGITLGTWLGYYNNGGATLALPWTRNVFPATTGTPWGLGATATIDSSATTGSFSPTFDLSCTIQ